jgi:hypothetical protein
MNRPGLGSEALSTSLTTPKVVRLRNPAVEVALKVAFFPKTCAKSSQTCAPSSQAAHLQSVRTPGLLCDKQTFSDSTPYQLKEVLQGGRCWVLYWGLGCSKSTKEHLRTLTPNPNHLSFLRGSLPCSERLTFTLYTIVTC